MASPRKRQKFISLNHSTPEHSSKDEESVSDVSTINSMQEQEFERRTSRRRLLNKENEPPQDLTSETPNTSKWSQNSSRRSSIQSSSLEEIDDYVGEDYDIYFKDLIRIRYTGQIWKLYKPVKENTLYANILEEPANVHIIITELLVDYKDHSDGVITSLIQLFVDITGFKHFDVSNHYNLSEYKQSSLMIIKLLETDEIIEQNDLVMKGKYLFEERNVSLAEIFQMGIYNFLQKLIRNLHIKNFLYDGRILNCLFEFVICMQDSLARCIKHTGVVIAMKILTALILVYNDIINDPDFVMDKSEAMNKPKAGKLLKQKMSLDLFIDQFYCIFSKNCRLQDYKLFKMRVECIGEAKIWIKYFPTMFISNLQTVNYIMKLIVDSSKEVRMATLTACEELFLIPQVVKLIKPFIKDFTESIGKRFWDVDIKVSKKAIHIFQLLYQIDANFISKERFKQIGNLIFDQYTPIAVAASAFFTKFFEKETNSPEETLLNICRLYINKKSGLNFDDNCVKEIIVEGFLHICKHMQNWELFCKLILFKDIDDETKKHLAELFSESVYQYINGKSDIKRAMSLCANTLDTSIHEKIAQIFPLLNKCFTEQSNPDILNEILRIIPLVNHYYLEKNYCADYTIMGNALRTIFNHHVNEMVLKNVAKVMFHLESIPHFATRAKQISETLCNETIENFRNITDYTESGGLVTKRLAILYQYYNFNDLLTFGQFSGFIKGVNDSVDLALLTCCKWHLIWQLKNTNENAGAMRQGQFDEIINSLKETCKQFFKISFELLQNEQKNQITLKEVYSIFCDFCCQFEKELQPLVKIYRSFIHLSLKIEGKHLQMALLMFLEKNVISNNNMTLFERRSHIVNYVDLILSGIMPMKNLVHIFKYYNLYYEEYGPIIDQCITELTKNKYVMDFIVDRTLINVYEDILKKYSLVDTRTDEAIHLKKLAKQFSTVKYFHNSKNLYTVLYILMREPFHEEKYFPFLYFVKPFLSLIDDSETQKKIYNSFKSNIPKGSEKNDIILYFGNVLKNIEVKGIPVTPKKRTPAKFKETETKKIKRKKGQNKNQSNPKSSGSKTPKKKTKNLENENETSQDEDMTIQDSDSDDLEGTLNSLQIE